jgi:hypothetical protein
MVVAGYSMLDKEKSFYNPASIQRPASSIFILFAHDILKLEINFMILGYEDS